MIEYYRFYEVETLISQGKVQEAVEELRALQKLYLELAQENSKLKVQLHDLEEILSISRNIIFDGDAYWLISGGEKQGPFCPKCYHANGDLIRMAVQKKMNSLQKPSGYVPIAILPQNPMWMSKLRKYLSSGRKSFLSCNDTAIMTPQ